MKLYTNDAIHSLDWFLPCEKCVVHLQRNAFEEKHGILHLSFLLLAKERRCRFKPNCTSTFAFRYKFTICVEWFGKWFMYMMWSDITEVKSLLPRNIPKILHALKQTSFYAFGNYINKSCKCLMLNVIDFRFRVLCYSSNTMTSKQRNRREQILVASNR